MRRPHLLLRLLLPAVFLLLGCPPPAPPSYDISTFGLGAYLEPGSEARFLAMLPANVTGDARANRTFRVELQAPGGDAQPLFRGRTDSSGAVQVVFAVPEEVGDPNAQLILSVDAGGGTLSTARPVYVGAVDDLLLTTDKPVYQPGQILHLRGLALNRATMAAAAQQPVTLTISDPDGNKLLQEEAITSDFGIAAVDLPLDAQAPSGFYTVAGQIGAYTVSDQVEVKPYTLPRFKVEFDTARGWYLPGEVVTGTVRAAYYFGKPVANAQVALTGVITDVARVEAVNVAGETDASGVYTFTFTMPDAFAVAADEEHAGVRTATLAMTVAVTDSGAHTERVEEEITAAESGLLVHLTTEAGDKRLVTGADNLLYVDVTDPGGAPAQAQITLTSDALAHIITATTDASGLVTVTLSADDVAQVASAAQFAVRATDLTNPDQTGLRRVSLYTRAGLLLRPDRAAYRVGDTLALDLFAPAGVEKVYFAVEKNGASRAFAVLPVRAGRAQGTLDLDGGLLGTLTLRAYARAASSSEDLGPEYSAVRYVLVNPAAAALDVQADAAAHKPGETATVQVQVTHDGAPLPAALGISVVDESVYALGESDPGFARTYFLLARQMTEARYGIEGFADLEDDAPSPYDAHALNSPAGATIAPSALERSRQLALAGALAQAGAGGAPAPGAGGAAGVWAYLARLPLALPLLGLALYDGTRQRRRLLIGLGIAALAAWVLVACAAPAMPAASAPASAAPAAEAANAGDETTATRTSAAPPRLRQFFPETLLWLPEVQTDADGRAQVEIPLADTITTWRMSIVASDRAGNLGSATLGLRAFQEFFVEPDLPTQFTVGDEIELPVSIYNYTDAAQDVRLTVQPAGWFTFTAAPPASVTVAGNDVGVAYIPLRITGFGSQTLRIDAQSATTADAVARAVTVVPNGQAQASTQSGILRDAAQQMQVTVPTDAIPGASAITLRLYPGVLSQMTAGFEALLQTPHGCFEQVTSTLYPAVLALQALRNAGSSDRALEKRAAEILHTGYQQLIAYEVNDTPGGFSWYGDPPPTLHLSAYGLMEFTEMARVTWVDPALIERTANYLMAQQQGDGTWFNLYGYGSDAANTLATTAWLTWALADAGYTDTLAVQRAIGYIEWRLGGTITVNTTGISGGTTAGQPRPGQPPSPLGAPQFDVDTYTLALAADALWAAGVDATPYLDALAARARPGDEMPRDYGLAAAPGIYWPAGSSATAYGVTWTGAGGYWADLETTALATHALARAGVNTGLVQQGLEYLLSQRRADGLIGSTQATVFTLKALLLSQGQGDEATRVTLTLDGGAPQTLDLPAGGLGVAQQVRFDGLDAGPHTLAVQVDGPQRPVYQLITSSYQPWANVAGRGQQGVRLDVQYDRTELAVNDTVQATATVELLAPGGANMLLVRLPVPPGFDLLRDDLQTMRATGQIGDFEYGLHDVRVYLSNVASNQPLALVYRLRARLPVRVQVPAASAYDYYRPSQQDIAAPVQIIVHR